MRYRILLLSIALAGVALAADPFAGVWKFDPGKSKFDAARPSFPKMTMEAPDENSYRRTFDLPGGKGQGGITYYLDGKEHTSEGGRRVTATRVDSRHFHLVEKVEGSVDVDWIVDAAGKTLTIKRKGVGVVSKRAVDEVLVYEKQ